VDREENQVKVVTLIPLRLGKDQRRRQLWDWTQPFLEELGWPIFTGDAPVVPFNRAAAVNAAAENAGDWDVALIGDADTIQEVAPAHEAAEIALNLGACVPWTTRLKLSAYGSEKLVRHGTDSINPRRDVDRRDRTSQNGGGSTIMVARWAWDEVRGMDPAFNGYGNEDLAFAASLTTLVVDPMPWVKGTTWHLWHKPARGVGTAQAATVQNRRLWTRYERARGNKEAMRQLRK
jgi:hypothetical protein